jgi:hypothetical protein
MAVNKIIGAVMQGAGNSASYMADKLTAGPEQKRAEAEYADFSGGGEDGNLGLTGRAPTSELTHDDPDKVRQGALSMAGNFAGGKGGGSGAGGMQGALQGIMGKAGGAAGAGGASGGSKGDFFKRILGQFGSDERMKETHEEPDMIADVAEKINNYLYHYKPGTGEDPNVEYSGPMAQDLLKVDGYRATVQEGPDGLLRVDTERLALVNAGMIADLSKRLLLLEEFIREAMIALGPIMQEAPEVPDEVDVE